MLGLCLRVLAVLASSYLTAWITSRIAFYLSQSITRSKHIYTAKHYPSTILALADQASLTAKAVTFVFMALFLLFLFIEH